MKILKRLFISILIILVIPTKPILSAGEDPDPDQCSLDDPGEIQPGDIMVNLNGTSLRSDKTNEREDGFFFPSSTIQAGKKYDITVEVWDHHQWVVDNFPPAQYDSRLHQEFEQLFLKLYDGNHIINGLRYTTNDTEDIPSDQDTVINTVASGLEINYDIDRIRIEHSLEYITPSTEPNSLYAICARFRPVDSNVVQGYVYIDSDRDAYLDSNGLCVDDETTGVQPGAGSEIELSDGSTGTIEADGSFSVSGNSPGSSVATINIADLSNWTCSCPDSCSYPVDLDPSTPEERVYYVTDQRNSWYQVSGGDIHAENKGDVSELAISNQLPASCSGSCSPYMSTWDSTSEPNSSGVISYGNGSVDLSDLYGLQDTTNLDQDTNSRIVKTFMFDDDPIKFEQGYQYFYRLQEFELTPPNDFDSTADDLTKPIDPTPDTAFYQESDVTINQPWNVAADESITIFIDGDLYINANLTVENGGKLIFIVSGNVIISPEVGNDDPDDETGSLEAIIVADGKISVEGRAGDTPDKKFVGEGIFVGWNGIEFDRDFHSDDNNYYPSVMFRYRPDMIFDLNRGVLRSLFGWKQVNP